MTLAHLPTQEAQDLLQRFQQSERAREVSWLECAVEEGKFHYLCSNNDQEERDLIALKLYYSKEDEIVELMGKCQTSEFKTDQFEIELDALLKLQKDELTTAEQEDIKYRICALKDLITIEKANGQEYNNEIEMLEKISRKIKDNITTERYKNLSRFDVNSIRFDGEEW